MKIVRAALLGVPLLLGAAPARAQHCGLEFAAGLGPGPGGGLCSELASTSSSASLWALPGLTSRPSVYDAFLDAIERIPQRDGLRGWATAQATASIVSPPFGRVALLGEFGVVGVARLNLPAPALDYFRSDTLADSLFWSFEGMNGLAVTFRSVGGGALVEVSDELTVAAMVRFLDAQELVGGHVSGGMLESFDGLNVDMRVTEYRDVRGSGTTFGFLAVLTRDEFRAALSVEQVGAASRLTAQNRVKRADSTYHSTREAVDALDPAEALSETVEVEWPARLRFALGRRLGRQTWVWFDSDVALTRGFRDVNGIGARLLMRPAPWILLEAGGGWSSGIDASIGLGISAGRLTWKIDGRSALNGRNIALATGFALY